MAGQLMSAVLWGPQRPLQPSLTEEQFICQHPPALLRYLIPPFARGRGLPWRHSQPHRSQIHQEDGSRTHLEGSGTSVCSECVQSPTDRSGQEWDQTNSATTMEWEFLYRLSDGVTERGERQKKTIWNCNDRGLNQASKTAYQCLGCKNIPPATHTLITGTHWQKLSYAPLEWQASTAVILVSMQVSNRKLLFILQGKVLSCSLLVHHHSISVSVSCHL